MLHLEFYCSYIKNDENCASFTSNNRDEIHNIVEKMNPETDRGVFSTTDCQQVN